jgi:hypothetical protein
MSETPYREPAEMPPEPTEPLWPKIRAAMRRLGLVALVTAGPIASINLWRIGASAVGVWTFHLLLIIGLVIGKGVGGAGQPDWFQSRSWAEIMLLAAWAPIVFPVLALKRAGQWVWTGK